MRIRQVIKTFVFEALQGQKQKRAEFLVKQLGGKWKGIPEIKELDKFIETVAEADPSKNGMYMQWIARMILKNPTENKVEDLPRLKGDLEHFEQLKSKLQIKDINQYKSFYDVYAAIEPLLGVSNEKSKDEVKLEKIRKDIIDVYQGPEGWIKIPTSQAAACYLGQQTRWCTAGRDHNMFNHYNNSDRLFVIYNKASKERFQLHIQSGQFADVTDRTKPMSDVPEWARRPIIDWYKKNNPNLNLKHLMTFYSFGDEEAAKGTDHEELFNLMKQYGVL